jgi:hypothetical protein
MTRRFETDPIGDDPHVVVAERLDAIAFDVERIREAPEGAEQGYPIKRIANALERNGDVVEIDRDVLADLVDVANGQLETMVPNGSYPEDHPAVQSLVETRDAAKAALEERSV